jgi:hypothetical protein
MHRLVLLSSAVAALGCGAIISPERDTRIYVLTSIAGEPIQSLPNIWLFCAPDYAAEGAEWTMLSDSVFLYPDGQGEARNVARFRYSVAERGLNGRADTAFLSPNHSAFKWRATIDGGAVQLAMSYGRGWSTVAVDRDGSYSYAGTCGTWRYERAPSRAAP